MNIFKKLFSSSNPPIQTTTLTVTSSNGFHLRPIAEFANEAKRFDSEITILAKDQEVTATQVPKILTLALEQEECFTLKAIGKDAEEAIKHLSSFFAQLMQEDIAVEVLEHESDSYEADTITGTPISKGIAVGVLTDFLACHTTHHQEDALSLQQAREQTARDLEMLYTQNQQKAEAKIFLAQKALLESELFQHNFANIDTEIKQLEGTMFHSRIADYRDLKKRIESYMGITITYQLPHEDVDTIIIADELLPSEVDELSKMPAVKGVILRQGSTTSHASILLRSFKIPSMIAHEKITSSGEYYHSILDASSGQFIDAPTDADYEKAEAKTEVYQLQEAKSHQRRFDPTQTTQGLTIKVLANITDTTSAREAKEQGADGVGLLRTEFLFTDTQPTLEEQTEAYTEIFTLFEAITIRTLDIGGDKSLPYIEIAKEDNPFLGVRGIRFSLQEQTLFREQLLAVGLAAAKVANRQIKIMFPMVATPEEFTQAKTLALDIYQAHNIDTTPIQFGIMLEVPSVLFALDTFDQLVDFYSIGTNDLTQYLFAIERTHPTLTANPTSPILMNALAYVRRHTHKPVSICGELAGLEEATEQLVTMGYDTLSVSAKLIPSLKAKIRNI
ncbi:MAG TPA: HPr family phosphocarrier protein [Campylobacterales bacterium]|nr:HPr family phosphocarrier protein [Campylobacterales bacterium]